MVLWRLIRQLRCESSYHSLRVSHRPNLLRWEALKLQAHEVSWRGSGQACQSVTQAHGTDGARSTSLLGRRPYHPIPTLSRLRACPAAWSIFRALSVRTICCF